MTLTKRLEAVATRAGATLADDNERVLNLMEQREHQYGLVLCPCVFLRQDITVEELISSACPCLKGMIRMKSVGECDCGLFVRK